MAFKMKGFSGFGNSPMKNDEKPRLEKDEKALEPKEARMGIGKMDMPLEEYGGPIGAIGVGIYKGAKGSAKATDKALKKEAKDQIKKGDARKNFKIGSKI
jgi:hypothetical protein